jgi:hypothetical protein
MKKVITLLLLSSVWLTNAQAFKGNGDVKGQVGLNLQDGGTGIFISDLVLVKTCPWDLPLIIYYLLTKTNLEIFQILDNGRFKSTI